MKNITVSERKKLIAIALDSFQNAYYGHGVENSQDSETSVLHRLIDLGFAPGDETDDLCREIVSEMLSNLEDETPELFL